MTKAAIKERPILFSGPMVRAIIEGQKTQTRRVIKGLMLGADAVIKAADGSDTWKFGIKGLTWTVSTSDWLSCPYGQTGEHLWVRETWMPFTEDGCPVGRTIYRATDDPEPDGDGPLVWRPSIFMPRDRARIILEIVSVRVERVRDISTADACAEGVPGCREYLPNSHAVQWYKGLWDSINAKRGFGWNTNPFVWVIEFTRI